MHYFQFRIFISKIKGVFRIFEIVLGADWKVLGVGSNCQFFKEQVYLDKILLVLGKSLSPTKDIMMIMIEHEDVVDILKYFAFIVIVV